MWIGMLSIIGCYGISIAVLHILFGARKEKSKQQVKFLIISKNNQNQIEWFIRSLFFFSRVKGRRVSAVIFDEGSSDDTLKIVERLSDAYLLDIHYQADGESADDYLRHRENERFIVVNLSDYEDLAKIRIVVQ